MGITQNTGASSLIKPGVIDNTAARPASPFEGQVIYQKDTDAVLVWNGTAWYPNWNTAWGTITYQSATSNSAGFSSETVMLTTSSFTAVTGRRYKITYFESGVSTLSGTVNFVRSRIRLTNISGTILNFSENAIINQRNNTTNFSITTSLSGSVTVCGTLEASGGGSGICSRGSDSVTFILVEDIGPA
jgi:hypothetical protein